MDTYTIDDFCNSNAPKEMLQYILDNVEGFDERYTNALHYIGAKRCSLQYADYELYDEIREAMVRWAIEFSNLTDDEFEEYDIEEIFG